MGERASGTKCERARTRVKRFHAFHGSCPYVADRPYGRLGPIRGAGSPASTRLLTQCSCSHSIATSRCRKTEWLICGAHLLKRVGRVISSSSETEWRSSSRAYRATTPYDTSGGRKTQFSLPALLVDRSEILVTCLVARRISFLDVSASRDRSSVRAMRPKGPHYKLEE